MIAVHIGQFSNSVSTTRWNHTRRGHPTHIPPAFRDSLLELNKAEGYNRRFILIEQGRPERGDPYAKTLTAERIRRVIEGQRVDKDGHLVQVAEKLPGTFRYARLMKAVDAEGVLALEREEMIDLLLTSYWDNSERAKSFLKRLPAGTYKHLFAVSNRGEGYFLVWSGPDEASNLGRDAFRTIAQEALCEGLAPPYHVYAKTSTYLGANVEFYQIPHKILEKLGFNETTDSYSSDDEAVA